MRNVYIHTGVRWELREYMDTATMTAYNVDRGREEDEVYLSMVHDVRFELPDMTEYYYTFSDDPYYINEDDTIRKYRTSIDKAMERFYTKPIIGWDMFQHFFHEVGYYPSEENLASAREYFNSSVFAN